MRFLISCVLVCFVFLPVSVAALFCDIIIDSEVIARSDLIVRAEIKNIEVKNPSHDFPKKHHFSNS